MTAAIASFMRYLLTLILVALTLTANARQISSDEAAAIASEVLNTSVAPSGKSPVKVKRVKSANDKEEASPYYIFTGENSRGFVIISGDDRAQRVLGYSDKATFDPNNVPPQLKALLESYAEQIQNLSGTEVHSSWKMPMRSSEGSDAILLETAEWGQGAPYNQFTPEINGAHAPTGCVATAMAIVMKYHNWPEHGYSWELIKQGTDIIKKDFCEYSFDYSNMPEILTTESSDVQKSAIALLMDAAGKAVRSEYGELETGAYLQVVGHEMLEKFSYSPKSELLLSSDYDWNEWDSIVRSQIDKRLPVIYGGSQENSFSKHAYILDGYNSDGLYHINWGWEGVANGFFLLNATDFSSDAQMIINCYPDPSEPKYSKVYCNKDDIYTLFSETNKINVSVENIESGKPFDLIFPTIQYAHPTSFDLAAGLTTHDGQLKEISQNPWHHYGYDDYPSYPLANQHGLSDQVFHSEILPTDYVQLYAKLDEESEWLPINGCSKISTCISVAGNQPRWTKIKFDVDHENIYFTCWSGSKNNYPGYDSSETPIDEVKMLFGDHCQFKFHLKDGRQGFSVFKISGKGAYDDATTKVFTSDKSCDYACCLMDNIYTVEAKFNQYSPASTVVMTEAGTLNNKIQESEAFAIGYLTIEGPINAWDLWYIRENMPAIKRLNLAKANIIEANTEGVFINSFQVNDIQYSNTMSDWALEALNGLAELVLPESLESFGNTSCSGLSINEIEIPKGVRHMGINTFFVCENLKKIICKNPVPPIAPECNFTGTPLMTDGTLYVPDESVDIYKNADTWKEIPTILPLSSLSADIHSITLPEIGNYRIFNMQGICLGSDFISLPSGIYIIFDGHNSWKIKK